jgi:signal transduction histidine kinase/PAS domain-containing protein
VTGSASAVPAAGGGRARDGPQRLWIAPLVAGASLLATGGGLYVISVSRHAPDKVGHSVVLAIVCGAYVGAALTALRRAPYVRFAPLLAAVGLSALLGALHDANRAVPYTIGFVTGNLVFAVLVHTLLAFPNGRLGSRTNRLLVLVAYGAVLGLQATAALFDPLTRWRDPHPPNAALVHEHAALATALEELEAAVAVALALAVALVLLRRVRSKTALARRQLLPVLGGGIVALVLFAVGLVLAPLSVDAAIVGIGMGLLASLALPFAFLGLVVHGRLSRGAVGELLVELREGAEAPGLEEALRHALGDPSLELARLDGGDYVDGAGRRVAVPTADGARVATPILHQGETVGALVHDRALRLRPELLDAVSAAAGFALANERALGRVRRVEERNRALLDAIPDLMFRVARDGTYLDVRAEDPAGLLRPPEQLIGGNVRDVLPADVAGAVVASVTRALDTGRMSTVEYELEIGGVVRCFESRMVPSGEDEIVSIVRDFTEKRRAEGELRRLAEEQAALRRVATFVAGDAPPEEVFQTVTEEACTLLAIRSALLLRYEDGGRATVVGKFGDPTDDFRLGGTIDLEDGAALRVLQTGAAARVDYGELAGGIAERMRAHSFRSSVGVPINVAGATWGVLVAGLRAGESLPAETEQRLQEFAELVALAVASAHAREEVSASRLRIVEASDAERRRLERNLHDGAQQRLVALSVGIRLAQAKTRKAPDEAEELLALAADDLNEALTELRELAQGIHPAVLTERGLAPALEVLAARTPLPVDLAVELGERLPEPVEAAAYYVVSEALANVVKHARARAARVRVQRVDGHAVIEVVDDGVGGADPAGSGLRGLRDRVETLSGRLDVEIARDGGTAVRAVLPVRPTRAAAER